MRLQEIRLAGRSLDRFREVIGDERLALAQTVAEETRRLLEGRVVWNVNSTAVGGGVAEMLPPLLGYVRGIGIDARWVIISGSPAFFRLTKRLHHFLHGSPGDGGALGPAERSLYEEVARDNATELRTSIRAGDIVVLHDPQTAGLAPALLSAGAHVVWRCHVGQDHASEYVDRAWEFLGPYLEGVSRLVFSRETYVPESFDGDRAEIVRPSIDVFSPKNQELSDEAVRTILVHTGLVEGPAPPHADHGFRRADGSPGRVERRADLVRLGRAPSWEVPLVVQISRWDPLKDMLGVARGFALLCEAGGASGADLVLAGPNVHAVADDPEGAGVFEEVVEAWRAMPHAVRNRIHLASLPTHDVQENAAIVNALQRHAAVVVQKSLREGFGLTVAEAMWKGRPVLASAVGGIQDQIEDGESGVLLKDPADLEAFAVALKLLLGDAARRRRLGEAARERVRERFLGVEHLIRYAKIFRQLLGG